jgi:hypothetical protein
VCMERKCNHGKGVCFIQKENWKGKNELKKIKEMMYATQKRIGTCEVMKVKTMEEGFNTRMTNQL